MRSLILLIVTAIAIPVTAADSIDYARQIKPILTRHCVMCHGPVKQEGGLRLDAVQLIRQGGDSGPAILAKNSAGSPLIQAVTGGGDFTPMPLDAKPLSPDEIRLLTQWIDDGAIATDEPIASDPRSHWAFQKPERPAVPHSPSTTLNSFRNPIDAFINAKIDEAGLRPVGEAAKTTLLRRVFLDLIGLPPTPAELQAFLADESPDAYEQVVDRLLQHPGYGERWGRHWMDVWRYSDWYGYRAELRNSGRHIWRWRDWIVESLNTDKPYDQMIVEMLAADEADPLNEDALRATGFLVRNYYKFNRDVWLDQTVEHTAKAFLGLTINCARCHDHMYDPIPQQAYYQFRAIFEPYKVRTDRVPGQPNVDLDGLTRAYDADLTQPTFLYVRGNDKQPDKEHPLPPAVPAFIGLPLDVEPVRLPVEAYYPGLREFVRRETLAEAERDLMAKRQAARPVGSAIPSALIPANGPQARQAELNARAAEKELAAAEARLAALKAQQLADRARFVDPSTGDASELARLAGRAQRTETLAQAEATVARLEHDLFVQREWGDEKDPKRQKSLTELAQKLSAARQQVEKAREASNANDGNYSTFGDVYPETSSGRRLALARWIVHPDNPLTARVAVNHIWLRHFGEPLVASVFEFGNAGQKPTHPELLDWLAVEFVESGWSMKHLHRLMVTSAAYRRSSDPETSNANSQHDPDNRLLWRMNVRRMEAEIVRDSVLRVAGELDPTLGGPELDANAGLNTYRRSLYYRHAPEKSMTLLETFDGPDAFECYRRDTTIVPQQALALANSTLSLEMSRRLAARLGGESNGEFVYSAFWQVLGREPTSDERELCLRFLDEQTVRLAEPARLTAFAGGSKSGVPPSADPAQRARENLVHVLLNHNDFVTIR